MVPTQIFEKSLRFLHTKHLYGPIDTHNDLFPLIRVGSKLLGEIFQDFDGDCVETTTNVPNEACGR